MGKIIKSEPQVSAIETEKILNLCKDCFKTDGDVVEFGCYEGDTSLEFAKILRKTDKKLWIYDSFEGLPEKSEFDQSGLGENFQAGALAVSKRTVKLRFLRAELPVPLIKKAWFSDLTPDDLPEKICFAFLDGDLYESIRDSLRLVEDKIPKNGIIVVHDYNNPALPGVAKAVDEWLDKCSAKMQIWESLAIVRF